MGADHSNESISPALEERAKMREAQHDLLVAGAKDLTSQTARSLAIGLVRSTFDYYCAEVEREPLPQLEPRIEGLKEVLEGAAAGDDTKLIAYLGTYGGRLGEKMRIVIPLISQR